MHTHRRLHAVQIKNTLLADNVKRFGFEFDMFCFLSGINHQGIRKLLRKFVISCHKLKVCHVWHKSLPLIGMQKISQLDTKLF